MGYNIILFLYRTNELSTEAETLEKFIDNETSEITGIKYFIKYNNYYEKYPKIVYYLRMSNSTDNICYIQDNIDIW